MTLYYNTVLKNSYHLAMPMQSKGYIAARSKNITQRHAFFVLHCSFEGVHAVHVMIDCSCAAVGALASSTLVKNYLITILTPPIEIPVGIIHVVVSAPSQFDRKYYVESPPCAQKLRVYY